MGRKAENKVSIHYRDKIESINIIEKRKTKDESVPDVIRADVEFGNLIYELERQLKEYKYLDKEIGEISFHDPERDIKEHLPDLLSNIKKFDSHMKKFLEIKDSTDKIKERIEYASLLDKYERNTLSKEADSELLKARKLAWKALNESGMIKDNKLKYIRNLICLLNQDDELIKLKEIIKNLGGADEILKREQEYYYGGD